MSAVVVGHWSKDRTLLKEHFNFTKPDDQCNLIQFSGSTAVCSHARKSKQGLLTWLISVLSYPEQTVVEMFPECTCGRSTVKQHAHVLYQSMMALCNS